MTAAGLGCGAALAQPGRANISNGGQALLRAQADGVAASGTQQQGAPIERRAPSALAGPTSVGANGQLPGPKAGAPKMHRGQHLAEWMNQHSGMTLEQQERALEREPGFQELPGPTQQRMRGRLAQLNEMTPMQRQRIIEHTEAMERLTLPQRSQVRGAMQQLSSLPLDQRKAVSRSFREVRLLPPDQRMAAMYSARYSWMNDEQRLTLTRLIQVAPMLPQQ